MSAPLAVHPMDLSRLRPSRGTHAVAPSLVLTYVPDTLGFGHRHVRIVCHTLPALNSRIPRLNAPRYGLHLARLHVLLKHPSDRTIQHPGAAQVPRLQVVAYRRMHAKAILDVLPNDAHRPRPAFPGKKLMAYFLVQAIARYGKQIRGHTPPRAGCPVPPCYTPWVCYGVAAPARSEN